MDIDSETAATLLGVSESTLRRWARQGRIHARKQGGGYSFRRRDIEEWAAKRNLSLREVPATDEPARVTVESALDEAFHCGGVHFSVPGRDRDAVLTAVAERIPLPPAIPPHTVLDRLLQREELASTAVGNGAAIPHPRQPLPGAPAGGQISLCTLEHPVDFGALDGLPVSVLYVMLSPDTKTHLSLLSRLSHVLKDPDLTGFVRSGKSTNDVLARIHELQQELRSDRFPPAGAG